MQRFSAWVASRGKDGPELAWTELGEGDLIGARAVLARASRDVDPADLVATMGAYWDLYWVLDDAQQALLLGLSPSVYDSDRAAWGIVQTQVHWLRGDTAHARATAEETVRALDRQLEATPTDPQRRVLRGLELAYLGRYREAIAEGERGVAAQPVSADGFAGPYLQHQLVRIYLLAGQPEKALDLLEPLLEVPYYLSSGWLRIDPTFDPLRQNPRFQKLAGSEG